MLDSFFFGYGSLVNTSTHGYVDTAPAILKGWHRFWTSVPNRETAVLSIRPNAGQVIKGLIARVPGSDWIDLDLRETGYGRKNVTKLVSCELQKPKCCAAYIFKSYETAGIVQKTPILMSYLDVVVQGFLQIYGESGAKHFFKTTDGWDRGIKNDRLDPVYPRACKLNANETQLIDELLNEHGAKIV